MAEKNSSMNGDQLITTMEDFYKKAPQLPANIRDVLVKIAPWFALVFGILGVLAGLSLVGVSPIGLVDGVGTSTFLMISGVLSIVSSVLMLMAFPKLQKLQLSGWKLIFWSEVVSVVASLVGINAGTIIGAVIGALIAFYILFQIKPHYK